MLKNPKVRANLVQLLGFSGTVEENTCQFEVLLLSLSLRHGVEPFERLDGVTGLSVHASSSCDRFLD